MIDRVPFAVPPDPKTQAEEPNPPDRLATKPKATFQ